MKCGGPLVAILFLLCLWCAPLRARDYNVPLKERYDIKHPLVFEDAWDMPPYSFLDKAEPMGLHIDIIREMMHRLGLQYIVRLRPTEEVFHDLTRGDIDLCIGIYTSNRNYSQYYGQASLGLYTYGVLHPRNMTIDTENLNNLRYQKISVQRFSYSYQDLIRRGYKDNIVPTEDIYDAIHRVDATDSGVVVNIVPTLQYIIDKYNLQNVAITPININGGDCRFLSSDHELLQKLDSVYAVMKAGEELVPMERRWFYPELQAEATPLWVQLSLGGIIVLLVLTGLGMIVYRHRERKAGVEAKRSLRQLTTYLQGNNLYIWSYDRRRDTYTVLFDPMGENREEHQGGEYRDLFTPTEYQRLKDAIDEVDSGRTKMKKLTLRPISTSRICYDVRIMAIESHSRHSHTTLGIFQNIGEAARRAEELRETSARYQNVIDTINAGRTDEGHTVFDIAGQQKMIERNNIRRQAYVSDIKRALNNREAMIFTYYPNRHALDLVDAEGGVSREYSQLQAIRFIDRSNRRMVSLLMQKMDACEQDVYSVVLRTRMRDKQGRRIYYRATGTPITGKDGGRSHYFGFLRDVTDQQTAQEQLEEEMRKAAEAEKVKVAFMRNISYEVRTPLSSVIGFAELLAGEHDAEDEALFMQQIRDNSAILLALVNDILRLSRLDAGITELQPMEIDFATIFASLCESGWEQYKKSGVTTIVEDRFDTLLIDIDLEQMSSIIEIVAGQGAYFTDKGVLQASYEYMQGNLIMLFEDTSTRMTQPLADSMLLGIDTEEDLDLCGHRLKLQIAAKLIEMMGGRLEISVRAGKGTTASITIPCTAKEVVRKVGHKGKEEQQ